jgi:hypothetical protein
MKANEYTSYPAEYVCGARRYLTRERSMNRSRQGPSAPGRGLLNSSSRRGPGVIACVGSRYRTKRTWHDRSERARRALVIWSEKDRRPITRNYTQMSSKTSAPCLNRRHYGLAKARLSKEIGEGRLYWRPIDSSTHFHSPLVSAVSINTPI